MNKYGTLTESGTIRFERLLPGSIEQAWKYLTNSKKRGLWLASGTMDLQKGGQMELMFNNRNLTSHVEQPPEKYKEFAGESRMYGEIIAVEPPSLLCFTWDEPAGEESEVTFELETKGDQVQLRLTHSKLGNDHDTLISVAGGWYTHLNILEDRLHGREPKGFWEEHMKAEKMYEKRLQKR